MDSVETHYAAQRDQSESPAAKPTPSPLRIPKRRNSILEQQSERTTKRMRSGIDMAEKSRFVEGRREESMSEQGQDIQNLTRQEFQKRWAKKLGIVAEGEDSIELESRRMPGKTDLGESFTFGKRTPNKDGKVIPVKSGGGVVGNSTEDSLSLSSSRDLSVAIRAPCLPLEEPSIILVPGNEPVIPNDKKIPMKHTPKTSKTGSRALVIPAAKPAKIAPIMRRVSARSAAPMSPSKLPVSYKSAKFTMGSVPATTKSNPRTKSQRPISKTISPSKPRITRSISSSRAAVGKELSIRSVNVDIKVPVKYDGGRGKRKYAEADESSPTKRMKLNEVFHVITFPDLRVHLILLLARELRRP